MNSESPTTSRPVVQFSLGMLILLTMTFASVLGVVLTISKRARLESQVRVLEYHERLSQATLPIHGSTTGVNLFPLVRQWVVYLPPGKSYQLCWKIHDPPVVDEQKIAELSADQQISLHPGERQIQLGMHDFQFSSPYIVAKIDGTRTLQHKTTNKWLPVQIESFYPPTAGDLEAPLQFPLELCNLIFVDQTAGEAGVRKSNMRMWIEEAAP